MQMFNIHLPDIELAPAFSCRRNDTSRVQAARKNEAAFILLSFFVVLSKFCV